MTKTQHVSLLPPRNNNLTLLPSQKLKDPPLQPSQSLLPQKLRLLRHRHRTKRLDQKVLGTHPVHRTHVLPLQPHSPKIVHRQQPINQRGARTRKARLRGKRVRKRRYGEALLQPRGQDVCGEFVVDAEFGAEDRLAVVPETIDTVEERGLVDGHHGLGEEEVEEERGDFALEAAEFGEGDGGGAGEGVWWLGSLGGLAFEDRLVAGLLVDLLLCG
jgi:hypothetical protein